MKRTIKEVYDLIKEKRDNALNDYRKCKGEVVRPSELKGEIDAYNDVLSLIESSHLLEEDKPVIKCEGIEALRNLTQIAYGNSDDIDNKIKNYFEIIEKELKEKELQDIIINEIKDLFAFGSLNTKVEPQDNGDISLIPNLVYRITREVDNKKKEIIRDYILKQCFPKELKALEIIKKKEVDYFQIRVSHTVDYYNMTYADMEWRMLTQEEFDLLKEVLL